MGNSCLYFGTFNPIHTGHLMIAQAVFNQFSGPLGLACVTFVPANNPPHRQEENDLLAARHRFGMVQLAVADNPAFRVSDVEMQRPGRSYTADTIEALLDAGLVQGPVPMIIGSDALAGLASWHRPTFLIEHVRFLQAPRPGYAFVDALCVSGETLQLNTCPIDMPMSALSSSWVRRQIQTTGNYGCLRHFVPEPARRYLADNRLYLNDGQ